MMIAAAMAIWTVSIECLLGAAICLKLPTTDLTGVFSTELSQVLPEKPPYAPYSGISEVTTELMDALTLQVAADAIVLLHLVGGC
mgnify:CR=1 FL=1